MSVSTGGQASGSFAGSTSDLVFSPDSQSLVFGSSATDLTTNLSDNTTNSQVALGESVSENLFLRDLATGKTTLLSVTTSGLLPAEGDSAGAVFSPDGNAVAFSSDVTDLTANGTDFTPVNSVNTSVTNPSQAIPPLNIFIRDLTTATTTLVTATPKGLQSNGLAGSPVFSPDGSALAFLSTATDLTSNPLDPTLPPGAAALSQAGFPAVSDNIFLRNLAAGTTTLVSATPSGMLSSGEVSSPPVFSPNGQYLAYGSDATDLTKNTVETTPPSVPGISATNSTSTIPYPQQIYNVFVTNLQTGTTTLASATTSGQLSNSSGEWLSFSPDSGSLYFTSNATDLTSNPPPTNPADFNGGPFFGNNLFVYGISTGTTSLISATTNGQLSDSSSINPIVSPDGQTIYYDSTVLNMTAGDTNPNPSTQIFAASAPFTASNQFQFASWNVAANESSGQVAITVLRSGPATAAASVNYKVEDSSAHAGTDYGATAGTLTYAAGQTSGTFDIPLVTSDHYDGTRFADLVLSNPQGASLGYPSAFLILTAVPASPTAEPASPTAEPASPTVLLPGRARLLSV